MYMQSVPMVATTVFFDRGPRTWCINLSTYGTAPTAEASLEKPASKRGGVGKPDSEEIKTFEVSARASAQACVDKLELEEIKEAEVSTSTTSTTFTSCFTIVLSGN
jgi:hypothetical protein